MSSSVSSDIVALLDRGLVLLDGGMGSSLISLGLADGACTELWNLQHPERVRAVHEGFLRAGSDVVQTNSFGANSVALARHDAGDSMTDINVAAAVIARGACDAVGHGLVAGNIGPSGVFLPPVGTATEDELRAAFSSQARALADGGVDYFSLETFSDIEEALVAVSAIQTVSDLPITACLTFDRKKRGLFTLMGNRPSAAFEALKGAGVCAVGANCSIGSEDMGALADELVDAASLPLILKPNAGMPLLEDGVAVYGQPASEFAQEVAAMASLGAGAVGGCCGSDQAFIAAIRSEIDAQS